MVFFFCLCWFPTPPLSGLLGGWRGGGGGGSVVGATGGTGGPVWGGWPSLVSYLRRQAAGYSRPTIRVISNSPCAIYNRNNDPRVKRFFCPNLDVCLSHKSVVVHINKVFPGIGTHIVMHLRYVKQNVFVGQCAAYSRLALWAG